MQCWFNMNWMPSTESMNPPKANQSLVILGHQISKEGDFCCEFLFYFHIPTWKIRFSLFFAWIPKQKWENMLWFFQKFFHTIFTPDFRADLHQLGMDGHVVVPWWEEWPELGCVILIDMYLPQKILYICNVYPSYKMQRYIRVCTLNIIYIYIHVCHVYIGYRIEDSSDVFGTKHSRMLDP